MYYYIRKILTVWHLYLDGRSFLCTSVNVSVFPTTLLGDEDHGSHQTPEVPTAPEGRDASSVSSQWSLHGFQPLAPKDRAPPANKCADCLQEPRNLASCAGFPLINPGCKWPFPVTLSLLYDTLTGEWGGPGVQPWTGFTCLSCVSAPPPSGHISFQTWKQRLATCQALG